MKNFLKESCHNIFNRNRSIAKKSWGRSMMEVLGVLLVLGLLTILTLKGMDMAMQRSAANKVLDDITEVHSKLSLSKKTYTSWTIITPAAKSRSGFEFRGQHYLLQKEGSNGDLSNQFVTYVRATIPLSVCKILMERQSDRLKISAIQNGSVSSAVMTDSMCAAENDLAFYFVSVNSCSNNADCSKKYGSGYVCVHSFCTKNSRKTCTNAADCGGGYQCVDGVCVAGRCSGNADCPMGHKCLNGSCVEGCDDDADCPADYICQNGICTVGCSTSNDCDPGYKCLYGSCVPNKCSSQSDCLDTEVCVNGLCVKASCSSSNPCPIGKRCLNGSCVDGCDSNANCPSGKVCNSNHQCVVECVGGALVNNGTLCCSVGISKCQEYNTNCTCKTCSSGYEQATGNSKCCEIRNYCTSYSSSNCSCTACDENHALSGSIWICYKKCNADSDCTSEGANYKCTVKKSPKVCKSDSCAYDSYCTTNFGSTYSCVNDHCKDVACSSDSDCSSLGNYKCAVSGRCVSTVCSSGTYYDHGYCSSNFGSTYACNRSGRCALAGICQNNYPDETCWNFRGSDNWTSFVCGYDGYCKNPGCYYDSDCMGMRPGYHSRPYICSHVGANDPDDPYPQGVCKENYCESDSECASKFGPTYECNTTQRICENMSPDVSCGSNSDCIEALGEAYECQSGTYKCVLKSGCKGDADCSGCKKCDNGVCVTPSSSEGQCCTGPYGQVLCRTGCNPDATGHYDLCDHLSNESCSMTYGPEYVYADSYWTDQKGCAQKPCSTDSDCKFSYNLMLYCRGGTCKPKPCVRNADCSDCGKCLRSGDTIYYSFERAGYCRRSGPWVDSEGGTCCDGAFCPTGECGRTNLNDTPTCKCSSSLDPVCQRIYGSNSTCYYYCHEVVNQYY